MKKKITASLFVLMFIAMCVNAQQTKSNIIGTWKLISQSHDGKKIPLGDVTKLKFISKKYFTWVSFPNSNKIIRHSVWGGTYTFDGKICIENFEYGGVGATQYLGKKYTHNVEIKGNKLHQWGKNTSNIYVDEVWERVEWVEFSHKKFAVLITLTTSKTQ